MPRDRERRNAWMREYKRRNRESERVHTRAYKQRLRLRAIEALGGRCERCGLDDERVLQVDHIHGGGNAERRTADQAAIYRRAIAGADDLGLLCANCHVLRSNGHWDYPQRRTA